MICEASGPEKHQDLNEAYRKRERFMIKTIKHEVEEILSGGEGIRKLPEDRYSEMKYPKILSVMHFHVDQYEIAGFGHLMIMHTTTKMGMELITMSFMPSEAVSLPYLLVDAMSMKKKRCVFVEYYGCGKADFEDEALKEVYERYCKLPDYEEKEQWYIRERQPYSLIKAGEEAELIRMTSDSVKAYLGAARDARTDPEYPKLLEAFRQRMIHEGNPSDKVLKMLLKEDGAETFMKNVIMPL